MGSILGMCGLDCAKCEGYIATQTGDEDARAKVAEKWRAEYNAPDITADDVICDGCLTSGGRQGGHCRVCDIRSCGIEKDHVHCGECRDYEGCESLKTLFTFAPHLKAALDELRKP